MKVVNIGAAVILGGSMIYHVVSGDSNHMLSDTEMYVLLALIGINFATYGAARALPGSPEYTTPEHRETDTTLRSVKPSEVGFENQSEAPWDK